MVVSGRENGGQAQCSGGENREKTDLRAIWEVESTELQSDRS